MPSMSRYTQLLLFSPSVLAAFVMSLSGLPGRQGLGDALRSVCQPSTSGFSPPLLFAPSGIRIDWGPILTSPQQLSCQLVTLFEASAWPPNTFFSSPPHRVILILWISYLPTILAIIHLTSYRNRVSWLPPVLGFYQWAAAALTFPLISSLLVPRLLPREQRRPLSKINIEGLVVGLVVGFFVPSYFLLFSTGPRRQEWALGWQFFPIWVWVVQYAWVWVRTMSRKGDLETDDASNSNALRLLVLFCGGSSFAGHVLVLSNLTHSFTSLLPPNGLHTLPTHSLLQLAHHTLAWDLGITHLSVCMTVIYFGSRSGGGVMASARRVWVGTLVGGLGVGVGREWWRSEIGGEGELETEKKRE